ncbi:hypothetical protein ACHAWF_008284 [Thalassiosira exigua]
MSHARNMSIARGSIVGQGDGGALVETLEGCRRRSTVFQGAKAGGLAAVVEAGESQPTTAAEDKASKEGAEGDSDALPAAIATQGTASATRGTPERGLSLWRVSIVEGGKRDEGEEEEEEKNPWSRPFLGIPVNYFSVGLVLGGSVNMLYPILIIQNGVTSSFYSAAVSLVTLFWSYKIFFGMLCDCLPIFGRRWKWYIIFFGMLCDCLPIFGRRWKWYIVAGWILCASVLIGLAGMGEGVSPSNLVIMLTLANLGYVCADVAADGFMVWMAHRESEGKRGRIQTLIYAMREVGRLAITIILIFGFSGPNVSCPGYEADPTVPCTTDESVASRNDVYVANPDSVDWCHQVCEEAIFSFGLTIPQLAWIIAGVNIVSIPTYFMLFEDKRKGEKAKEVLRSFWQVLKKKAVWMLILYKMVSSITFDVYIACKNNANFVWLDFTNAQQQTQSILENLLFVSGLFLIRRYGLNWSWRKMIWAGTLLVSCFNLMYLLIVFDVIRNPWFYIFTDVTDQFMVTLNFLAASFAMVEVCEPGYEAISYALITTAGNATIPLSVVISYQFMALFPVLNTQEGIATDTPEVRRSMALLILIVEAINLSSLLALPMLPRQKKEANKMMEEGEESVFWSVFTIISVLIFMVYSTIVTFMTVAGGDAYSCFKVLGGAGCSENESSVGVTFLICACFAYCYGVNFYHTFWPF